MRLTVTESAGSGDDLILLTNGTISSNGGSVTLRAAELGLMMRENPNTMKTVPIAIVPRAMALRSQ